MSPVFHLVVWIDHKAAHLFAITREKAQEMVTIHAPNRDRGHIHHRSGTRGDGHAGPDPEFLRKVADAMAEATEILIVGPAEAKTELKSYLDLKMPLLAARVIGVEPMGRPGLGDVHDFATLFFHQRDRMMPNPPR